MKRIFLTAVSALALALSMVSCEKETSETLTGEFLQSGLYGFQWSFTDRIKVFNSSGQGIYAPQSITNGGAIAEFALQSGTLGNPPCRAFYPASLTVDGNILSLPAEQYSLDGSLKEIPMYANLAAGHNLKFASLCGVIKLHLQKADVRIRTISVSAQHMLCGDFVVRTDGTAPQLSYSQDGSNTVTLICSQPQSIDNGADFYLYLTPSTQAELLRFSLTSDNDSVCNLTLPLSSGILPGSLYELTPTEELSFNTIEPAPEGALNGLFSVSPTKQVYFSQGNLQYNKANAQYRFTEHQYDVLPIDHSNRPLADSVTLFDGFEWGTGADPTHTSTTVADYITDFVDWGINPISNGGNQANLWRTLTRDEWVYLVYERDSAYAKYGICEIDGHAGFILLPDNWIAPTGCTFTPGFAHDETGLPRNIYTLYQWEQMERSGAVSLPIVGVWIATGGPMGGNSGGHHCYVCSWIKESTNSIQGTNAPVVGFGCLYHDGSRDFYLNADVYLDINARIPVRLVTNAR